MSDYVEITWTSGSLDEARKVARYLVKERFVACAQIVPWIESIYMWNNQLETTQESKVVMKTRKEKIEEITAIILENSSYDVPEICWSEISGGNQTYLEWIDESCGIVMR